MTRRERIEVRVMRDKIVAIRVSSRLLDKFNNIVASKTRTTTYAGRTFYEYEGRREFQENGGKFTLVDLVENSLKEYIERNL